MVLIALGFALPAAAGGVVNASSFTGTAIEGYDPAAYFHEGRPVEGENAFAYDWMGATRYCASAENRDLSAADPDRYAPQYGGYCAWAVAQGHTAKIDPEAWQIVDGKLYPNYAKDVQAQWSQDIPATSPGATSTGRDPRRPRRLIHPRPRNGRRPESPTLQASSARA